MDSRKEADARRATSIERLIKLEARLRTLSDNPIVGFTWNYKQRCGCVYGLAEKLFNGVDLGLLFSRVGLGWDAYEEIFTGLAGVVSSKEMGSEEEIVAAYAAVTPVMAADKLRSLMVDKGIWPETVT